MSRTMRPADLYDLRTVGAIALRPSDSAVVYAVTWPDLDTDSNRSQLHVHESGVSRKLTNGHDDGSPRFSPSGQRLTFLRSEEKSKPILMVLDWGPGEARSVGDFPDGVVGVEWLDDSRLVVLATDRPADQVGLDDDELSRLPRTIRSLNYRFNGRGWTHDRKVQIYVLDLDSGQQTRISNPEFDHSGVAIDPSGEQLATVISSDDDSDLTGVSHIWTYKIDGSDAQQVTALDGSWDALCWHQDGPLVAAGSPIASRIGFSHLHRFDQENDGSWSKPVRLGNSDVNIDAMGGVPPMAVDGAVLALCTDSGATVLNQFPLTGSEPERLYAGQCVLGSFAMATDSSRLLATISSPTRPAELWDLTGDVPQRLTFLNDDLLAELDLVEPETVDVVSADGTAVEAWIYRPTEQSPPGDRPGPGLVYVHGGPMAQYSYGFFDEFQLAAAEGFTVIAGNPRGSDGYGEAWATHIVGHLGESDWEDVTAIADYLGALPEVDEARVGLGGGSYGGYMAAWAVGHTDRFKAVLVERAVTNWETFGGTTDIPFFVSLYMDAAVEGDVESIRRQSPITYAANATSPTLILHSEEDWRCPIEQGEQFFAALRRNGCDVTMVRFPGENHELSRGGSPRHRIERFEIIHSFFNRHLG